MTEEQLTSIELHWANSTDVKLKTDVKWLVDEIRQMRKEMSKYENLILASFDHQSVLDELNKKV